MAIFRHIRKKIIEKQLTSSDEAVRLSALRSFIDWIDENSVSLLISLLEDPNTQIKLISLELIKEYPSEEAKDALIQHLIDDKRIIRTTVIKILHLWDPEEFSHDWAEIVNNINPERKIILFNRISTELKTAPTEYAEILISALSYLGIPKGIDLLFEFLEKSTNDIPNDGKSSFLYFDRQNLIRGIGKIIRDSIIKLNPTPKQIIPQFLNKNAYFRREFIELLRILPCSQEYYEIYLQLLEDPDIEIHKIATILLSQQKNIHSIIPLIKSIPPNIPGIIIDTLRALSTIDPIRFGQINYRNWIKIYSLLTPVEEKEIIPPIFEYLINWNEKTRNFAEEIFKTLVDIKYLPQFEQYLQRPELYIKKSIIRILKAWKNPECILVILKQFILSDWTHHDELVNALSEMDASRFQGCDKNQIIKRLSFSERIFLIDFIKSIQVTNLNNSNENLSYFLALIPHNSPDHENQLIQLMEHENIHIAGIAIQTIGEIRSKKAVPHLIKKLTQYQRSMKLNIIQTLGKIQDISTITPIIQCFQDSDQFLNRAIISALTQFNNNEVENQLINQIKNPNWNIRHGVAYAFGAIGTWRSVPSLIQLTSDEIMAVRRMAVFSLGEIRTEDSLIHLKSLISDKDENIVVTSLISLGKFTESKVSQLFLQMLTHSNRIILHTAAIQLGKFGDPRSLSVLKEILYDDASLLKKEAVHSLSVIATTEAVQILLDALSISNNTLNDYIVGALNQLLSKIPSITLPLLHKHYRQLNRSIPECYHLFEILPSLTGFRLFQFTSLDPGSLINEWLRARHPLALQILEEYGIEAEPYLERIIEQINLKEEINILKEVLQRIRQNNRVQTKEDFYFLL